MRSIFIVAWALLGFHCSVWAQPRGLSVIQAGATAPHNLLVQDTSSHETLLLGYSTRGALQREPFSAWFAPQYNSYTVDNKTIAALKAPLRGLQVLVYMGTWCGDSQREVPRFYKIMDSLGIDSTQLTLVTLAGNKQCPDHLEKGMHIHHVPTFIFYESGKELCRITQEPVKSLEEDICTIVSAKPYTPYFSFSEELAPLIEKGPKTLRQQLPNFVRQHKSQLKSVYELNTYGRVLRQAKRFEVAQLVLQANLQLFPKEKVVYYALGRCYEDWGNHTRARRLYQQALSMPTTPDNQEVEDAAKAQLLQLHPARN